MTSRIAAAKLEFRESWRVIVAAMVGMGLGFGGLPLYTFGIFLNPLMAAFGWSLSSVGSWTFFANLGYVCTVAFAGRLVDRWGVRPVILFAIPLLAVVLASMGLIGGHLWMLYATGIAVGCVGVGTTAITYARAVNSWFDAGRGTALGLMSTGIGLTSMITPLVLQLVADRYGWRVGFFAMGLMALSTFPLMYVWLTERGRGAARHSAPAELAPVGDTRAMAMRRPVFWLVGGGYLATCLANGGIVTYLVSFLTYAGVSRSQAAAYAGLLGIASMSGRLIGGFIIDRLHFAIVCSSLLVLQAAACAALGLGFIAYAPVLILVIGFALGVEVDCMTYSTARYYGMRSFSEICGTLGVMGGIGQGLGSVLFGRLAGGEGHYGTAFFVSAGLVTLGAVLFASAYRYPFLTILYAPGRSDVPPQGASVPNDVRN